MLMLSPGVCMDAYINNEDLKKLFNTLLSQASAYNPAYQLIGDITAGDIKKACQAVLSENMDLTLKSEHNSIKVNTWAITPLTFEELWGSIKNDIDHLDNQILDIVKIISKNIYHKFYKSIKEQLEK